MTANSTSTKVVIVGAGASGLTVAALLQTCGISCIVLERRSLQYIGERQRAGNVENRNARMYREWGLEQMLTGPDYDGSIEFRVNGKPQPFKQDLTGAQEAPLAKVVPQGLLVYNLITYLQENNADLRFEAEVTAITGCDTGNPVVTYTDAAGETHEISCDFVAGCDGFHGFSRTAIPEGVLTKYERDFGMSWLNIQAEVTPRVVMAIGEKGYAAHYPRHTVSRIYLQCDPSETAEDWPDERVWQEFRDRMGEPDFEGGPISDKLVFPLRSVVFEPMQYGRLFLVGDSAHIILPSIGKGMNLALYDAEMFGIAMRDHYIHGDDTSLREYSDRCLPRTWQYQEYTAWVNEMLHLPSTMTGSDEFGKKLAKARFDRLFTSTNWHRAFSEMLAGLS